MTTDEHDPGALDKRYLYCLVDASGMSTSVVDTDGVEGRPVSVIQHETIGAVVHECESVYDTDDEGQLERWLVEHQRVVDAAGEAFGTPLPVRFDTVLDGGEETVEEWLSAHAGTIRAHLDDLADCWEYRIQLDWDSVPFRQSVRKTDEKLRDLERRQAESGAGKRFMLQKRYSTRMQELVTERKTELRASLDEQVTPIVRERTDIDSPSGGTREDGKERVVELAVLAEADREAKLGDALDVVAERRGVEVRFTGPWPPYTFAPELG